MHALHALASRGPYVGGKELSCADFAAKTLDRPEQCCGVCLPTLTDRGSASWPTAHIPLVAGLPRRPTFRQPTFSRWLPGAVPGTVKGVALTALTPAVFYRAEFQLSGRRRSDRPQGFRYGLDKSQARRPADGPAERTDARRKRPGENP